MTQKERKVIEKLPKTVKSDDERARDHKAKVENQIKFVAKWMDKLGKSMSSRKYPMTDAQKQFVLEYLVKINDKFVGTISGTVEAKPDFKLPE